MGAGTGGGRDIKAVDWSAKPLSLCSDFPDTARVVKYEIDTTCTEWHHQPHYS